jgi:AraC-like DNA-binding protein/mannose-6-phosphate isomerase-like protein (cupin superfamily)
MRKIKNTIPVYDIGSLDRSVQQNRHIVVAPFADYLEVHPNLYAPHRHDFYHMVLFTAGNGFHTIDFEQFPVQRGQLYCMIPGQVHSWNFEGRTDGFIINFSEELFQHFLKQPSYPGQFSFFRGIAADSVIDLPEETYKTAVQIMKSLLQEARKAAPMADDMICAQLVLLFVTLHRTAGKPEVSVPQHNHLLLQHFRRLVDEFYTEKHLPKEYAAMLYITPNHLNALCKDLLGKPAGEVIRDRIVLEAKRLLVNLSLNIAAISDRLNFSDNSYFTKFFKKYTGLTPEEFRRKATGRHD